MSDRNDGTPSAVGLPSETLLTTEEVAAWLGIKKCTLEKGRSMRIASHPPYVRIGRVVRYQRAAVKAWLRANTFNVDGSPGDLA